MRHGAISTVAISKVVASSILEDVRLLSLAELVDLGVAWGTEFVLICVIEVVLVAFVYHLDEYFLGILEAFVHWGVFAFKVTSQR